MTVRLNPTFVFDTLVPGDFNQLAVAAGKAVVRSPGTSYNPLYVYGGTSVGKTHLLMAVGNLALSRVEGPTVEYLTIGSFEEAYRAAQAAGEIGAFRNRFADVDLILIDDVQMVQGRAEVQGELLSVVQQIRGASHQVVLAGSEQPTAMEDIDHKLVEVLNSGLVVDIAFPDQGERRRIIESKLQGRNTTLSDDAIDVLSDPDLGDLREVFSQLQRLIAFQEISEGPLDARVASEVVHGRFSAPFREEPSRESIHQDEFSHFFDDVASALSTQIESWGQKLKDAIRIWGGQGFDTGMLEEAARNPGSASIKDVMGKYEAGVRQLLELQDKTANKVAHDKLPTAFFNPGDIGEAEALVAELDLFGSLDLPGPTPDWSFATLVVADSNQEAVAAATSAVTSPTQERNPLVIRGPLGVGKSHLLHALANKAAELGASDVCCFSTHDLVREAERVHGSAREIWRHRYLRLSALFLDDFQLLNGQVEAKAVSEILRQAIDAGTQVVVSWSGSTEGFEGLDPASQALVENGAEVILESPGRDLRLELIHSHFMRAGVDPSRDLLDYLADRHVASLREIQSQTKRVLDEAAREEEELTPAFARQVLEGVTSGRRRSSLGVRASGIMVSPGVGIRSTEKMIWYWPELADRLIEDLN